jgi:ERF superfamily
VKSLYAALVKAQKDFGPALKKKQNPHLQSKYADLAACMEAVTDALNNNGLALVQHTHECTDGVTVETMFLHESGESYSTGKLHVPANKKDAQGYGSALTYARRYSLMTACGIAPEDDDDGHRASEKTPDDEYEAYEAKHLDEFRAVALNGIKALNEKFDQLPKSKLKNLFWSKHRDSLIKAASKVK